MANTDIQKATAGVISTLVGLALLLLVSMPVGAAADPEMAAAGPLSLQLYGPKPAAMETVAVRTLTASGWQAIEATASLGSGGVVVTVPHGCLPGARLVVEFPDVFGLTSPLDTRCGSGVKVNLWPRAAVEGKLEAPRDGALPAVGELLVARCPRKGEPHRSELEIPVAIEADGRWRSLFPASCGCFSLAAGDYASLVWHTQEGGKPGSTLDVGTRTLAAGGHLRVRAVDAGGQALAGLRVEVLTPREAELQAPGVQRVPEESGILRSAASDAQGWVDLRGLPPGQWVLRATPPGSKRPAFGAPIEVESRAERVIDQWVVAPTASLEVQLTPVKLVLEMEVVLLPQDIASAKKQMSGIDPTGAAHFNEIAAGSWLVLVYREVDGAQQEVARRTLKIQPGRHQTLVLPVQVE